MDDAWERAVEAALGGQADSSSSAPPPPPRSLTLDGSVKCLHGRLPPPGILERYQSLEHLSIANVGVSSLEMFPRLRNLQRLILSDNRIAGGLEFLVEAGLDSLRDLDLSNNRIQFLEDLAPLAQLRLVSLDLYECPVTRIKDYRLRVFGMIRTLKYLDKMDADENERPESDEEEEEEEEEEDEEDEEEDPGSGEVDGGGDMAGRLTNGFHSAAEGGIVDVDDDEESDAEEEETETGRRTDANDSDRRYHRSNGFRIGPIAAASVDGEEDEEDVEDDDEDDDRDLGEEIDAEEGEDDEVVEMHDVGDSDEDVDGVEEEGDEEVDEEDEEFEDGDGEGEEEQEDVEDEADEGEPGSTGRLMSAEGEIDGHEQGEGDEDENGEIGEEDEQGVDDDRYSEEGDGEDDEDEDDDIDGEYLVQPIVQPAHEIIGSDIDARDEEDEVDDEEDDLRSNALLPHRPSSSQPSKRKRADEDDLDDDSVEDLRSSKHR